MKAALTPGHVPLHEHRGQRAPHSRLCPLIPRRTTKDERHPGITAIVVESPWRPWTCEEGPVEEAR